MLERGFPGVVAGGLAGAWYRRGGVCATAAAGLCELSPPPYPGSELVWSYLGLKWPAVLLLTWVLQIHKTDLPSNKNANVGLAYEEENQSARQ